MTAGAQGEPHRGPASQAGRVVPPHLGMEVAQLLLGLAAFVGNESNYY